MKKEHQIIMLPSESLGCIGVRQEDGILQNLGNYNVEVNFKWKAHHLYILSDEEIKEGDWFINLGSCGHPGVALYKANSENSKAINEFKFPEIKKIIGTTDSELNKVNDENKVDESWFRPIIPQIPQHIIEAYVKKPFDKVMVEYESFNSHVVGVTRPKLNSDRTLAVSLIEEKMYTASQAEGY